MSKDYADMLKPIRDLAKNWDINIASCLEDYIQDLEKITVNVDVDGVKSQMNFAQAALLIQGSSAVYARKVEYLHSLVYKTLEALTEKKNKKSKVGLCVAAVSVAVSVPTAAVAVAVALLLLFLPLMLLSPLI